MSIDHFLTIAAIALEVGVPALLVGAYFRVPRLRSKLASIFGALTLASLFYQSIVIAFLVDPENASIRFAFFAGWLMSALAYLFCLAAGVALSFIPWPRSNPARFTIGAASTAMLLGIVWGFR